MCDNKTYLISGELGIPQSIIISVPEIQRTLSFACFDKCNISIFTNNIRHNTYNIIDTQIQSNLTVNSSIELIIKKNTYFLRNV